MSPETFTTVINSYLPEPQASLLNGIIFGVDLKTSRQFYQELKIVGLLHLVVLSGINITMLGAVIGAVTGRLGRWISSLITIAIIVLFIWFVGPQAPIVRAGIMGILTLVSVLYGRRSLALYALLLSGVFIGLFWPKWLGTVSFQLSFGATLGIILFGRTNVRSPIARELRLSLAAQLFTAPIIFLYFKQVSLISPLSNVLVAPLIAPLMIFGFATAFLGKVHFVLGLVPAYLSYGILTYIVFVVEVLSRLPFVFFSF